MAGIQKLFESSKTLTTEIGKALDMESIFKSRQEYVFRRGFATKVVNSLVIFVLERKNGGGVFEYHEDT